MPVKDPIGDISGLIESVRHIDLDAMESRAAAIQRWVALTRELLEDVQPGSSRRPEQAQPPRPTRPVPQQGQPTSLRAAIREIAQELLEPTTVAEIRELLKERGLTPKDDDSVDSTIYNLKKAGEITLKKIGKRRWAPEDWNEAAA
ncbi:MAG TPA: hypothetical protein VEI97_13910 [bacterium]|nr:hypothetical protein [bacterium]